MKMWIYMLILLFAVAGLCIWDGLHTTNVFSRLEEDSTRLYENVINHDNFSQEIIDDIWNLNSYWTEKMDTLSVSISRKDLQPISDFLQYLCASTINNKYEDAITYSALLKYNVLGIKECTGFNLLNLL